MTDTASLSIGALLLGAAQTAVRESVAEVARAEGRRGMVYLNVALCLGDRGEPLWEKSAVYFEGMRHQKDAARERSVE